MYAMVQRAATIVVCVTPTPTITTQHAARIALVRGAVAQSQIAQASVTVVAPLTVPVNAVAAQALMIVACVIRTQVTTTQHVAKIVRARGAAALFVTVLEPVMAAQPRTVPGLATAQQLLMDAAYAVAMGFGTAQASSAAMTVVAARAAAAQTASVMLNSCVRKSPIAVPVESAVLTASVAIVVVAELVKSVTDRVNYSMN